MLGFIHRNIQAQFTPDTAELGIQWMPGQSRNGFTASSMPPENCDTIRWVPSFLVSWKR
jgi:hypothetical protein